MENLIQHLFFPTALHTFKYEMTEPERAEMIQFVKGSENESATPADGLSIHTRNNLHRVPCFSGVLSAITAATKVIIQKLEYEYEALELTGLWGNVLAKGNSHAPHAHSNHLLSGVFYLQSDEDSSPIHFLDPRPQAHVLQPRKTRENLLNSDVIVMPSTVGSGIIFPSWLTHWVPPTGSERISLSWNVVIRGKYGDSNSLQDVRL